MCREQDHYVPGMMFANLHINVLQDRMLFRWFASNNCHCELRVLVISTEPHNVTFLCQLWMSSTGIFRRGPVCVARVFGPDVLSVYILGVAAPAKQPKIIHPGTRPSQPITHTSIHSPANHYN